MQPDVALSRGLPSTCRAHADGHTSIRFRVRPRSTATHTRVCMEQAVRLPETAAPAAARGMIQAVVQAEACVRLQRCWCSSRHS